MKLQLTILSILILNALIAYGQQDKLRYYINTIDLVNNGEIERAEAIIDSLKKQVQFDTLSYDYGIVLASEARLLEARNNREDAYILRLRSILILEKINFLGRAMAIFYADMGFHLRQTNLDESLAYYLKANSIFRELKDYGSLAQSYYTMHPLFKNELNASACLFFAKLSVYYYEKSNDFKPIDSTNVRDLIFMSSFIQAVGQAYTLINADSSKYYYNKAIRIIDNTDNRYANYYKYIGHMGIFHQNYKEKKYNLCLNNINNATKYFLQLNMDNTGYHGDLLLYKGIALNGLNLVDSAEKAIRKSLEIYNAIDSNYRWKATCYSKLSEIEEKRGDLNQAFRFAHKAMFANAPYTNEPEDIDELLPIDSVYNEQNTAAEAIKRKAHLYFLLYQKYNDIDYLLKSNQVYSYYFDFIFYEYYNKTASLNELAKRFETNINEALNEFIDVARIYYSKTNDVEVVKRCYKQFSKIKAGLIYNDINIISTNENSDYLNLKGELKKLTNKIDKLNFELKYSTLGIDEVDSVNQELSLAYVKTLEIRNQIKNLPSRGKIKDFGAFETNSLMTMLDSNEVVLDYYYSDSLITIFAITTDDISINQYNVLNISEVVLQSKRAIKTNHFETQQQASSLYTLLLEPTISMMNKKNKIIFIPYKSLYDIPFEWILTPKGRYLISDYNISYNISSQQFFFKRKAKNFLEKDYGFIGYAPEFGKSNSKQDFAMRSLIKEDSSFREAEIVNIESNNIYELPYANKEVKQISSLFQKNGIPATLYTGKEATKEHFLQNYKNKTIIHIASHGYASMANPSLSGIFFGTGNNSNESYLYLNEIYSLQFDADLVVLSACQSGKGDVSQIEGSISLPRGFIYAGVPNVIASLWKVHDEKTKDLMVAFYKHLLEDKVSYAEALRLAKLDCIAKGFLPMDWAGFVLIGN